MPTSSSSPSSPSSSEYELMPPPLHAHHGRPFAPRYTLDDDQRAILATFRTHMADDASLLPHHKRFADDACLCR
jgi:hypothetical protein